MDWLQYFPPLSCSHVDISVPSPNLWKQITAPFCEKSNKKHQGPRFSSRPGLSAWSLHIVSVFVWVSSDIPLNVKTAFFNAFIMTRVKCDISLGKNKKILSVSQFSILFRCPGSFGWWLLWCGSIHQLQTVNYIVRSNELAG